MKKFERFILIYLIGILIVSCSKNESTDPVIIEPQAKELTIFHINDQHGKIDNFSKIKHIIDAEKKESNVLVVCGGDIFSGNPVVDNHEEKGFPMIDLMNKVGFDVAVLGNHEFDYGEAILKDRLQQAEFSWVCANVDMNDTGLPEPDNFKTVLIDGMKITFLGLVETNGKEGETIPLTHPWRVKNLTFQKHESIIRNYEHTKTNEQSDLFIALTHLGESVDFNLANNHPIFDLIIGGHSHTQTNAVVNNTPIVQAGANLNFLGKIKLTIDNRSIQSIQTELIDLANYTGNDGALADQIAAYNENANIDTEIGYSEEFHTRSNVGCFYTDALLKAMDVDICFQNTGGIRFTLDKGPITKRDIYTIDPFSNGSVIYEMTVQEIIAFLKGSNSGNYIAGFSIEQDGNDIIFKDNNGQILPSNHVLRLGLNDYIPAVYDNYFTKTPTVLPYTTAEMLIHFLESDKTPINYSHSSCFLRLN